MRVSDSSTMSSSSPERCTRGVFPERRCCLGFGDACLAPAWCRLSSFVRTGKAYLAYQTSTLVTHQNVACSVSCPLRSPGSCQHWKMTVRVSSAERQGCAFRISFSIQSYQVVHALHALHVLHVTSATCTGCRLWASQYIKGFDLYL